MSLLASLQGLPVNPEGFGVIDTFGVPAALGLVIAVLLYLLYNERQERKTAQADAKTYEAKYEANLMDEITRWRERDRTLELIAKTKGPPDG